MPIIRVTTNEQVSVCDAKAGETMLQTLQRYGLHLPAPCGGVGKCGKCAVTVSDEAAAGPRSADEDKHAPEGSGTRLACRAVPVSDLDVELPATARQTSTNSDAKGGTFNVPVTGVPVIRSVELDVAAPTVADQRSLNRRILDAVDIPGARITLTALAVAARMIRDRQNSSDESESLQIAALVRGGQDVPSIVRLDNEVTESILAVAVDIGTTTIAAYLVDLAARDLVAVLSEENRQSRFGADVVSRIASASDGQDLTAVVRQQIAAMLTSMCADAGVEPGEVLAGTVVGNPTMIHLYFGLDPHSIGQAPFMPVASEQLDTPFAAIGLSGGPDAVMSAPAGMSAYVGADITADIIAAGLAASESTTRTDGPALLIDVGTNGEMVLRANGRIYACSTAAGPAFEGANIRCGSGGVAGAISSVERDKVELKISTIAGKEPGSICGPGLMDAVAMFLSDGVVDETGRLDTERAGEFDVYRDRVVQVDGEDAIVLAGSGDSRIVLTQADIRQVQLAKGAIAAGVRCLLSEAGVNPDGLANVFLAGGFGTYVRPESALRVGLIPAVPAERISSIGNAAGAGAVRLLVDETAMQRATEVAESGLYIELSSSQSFQEFFMEEMMFPSE